jgi:hypothetical protein
MTFYSVSEWPTIRRKFCTQKAVDLLWGSGDILCGNGYMLVRKTPLLKLRNTDRIMNRTKDGSNIFHESRKILLKHTDDQVRSVIDRVVIGK